MPKVEKTTSKAEKIDSCMKSCRNCGGGGSSSGCMVYVLGLVGTIIYFFGQSSTFVGYLWAIGKAFVWPALLTYQAFTLLSQ